MLGNIFWVMGGIFYGLFLGFLGMELRGDLDRASFVFKLGASLGFSGPYILFAGFVTALTHFLFKKPHLSPWVYFGLITFIHMLLFYGAARVSSL